MDDDYEELGFGGLDYLFPGVDLTLWLRIVAGLAVLLLVGVFMAL
jgi:hypothetical protein